MYFFHDYDKILTSFKYPTKDCQVHAILDACHMLKLARTALEDLNNIISTTA